MNRITLSIVDDQQLFLQGLAALIRDIDDFELLQVAETGQALLDQFADAAMLPDILLMDMKLPDMNGLQLNEQLQKRFPSIKVIVVSMYDQERIIYRMIEAGACGYLVKNCSKEELITAITSTAKTGFYFNFPTMQAMRHAAKFKNQALHNINNIPIALTRREEEVLQLICKELTNAEIAEKLFISLRTVDGHRNNLLAKTGCKNTAGLVIFAIRFGIYELTL